MRNDSFSIRILFVLLLTLPSATPALAQPTPQDSTPQPPPILSDAQYLTTLSDPSLPQAHKYHLFNGKLGDSERAIYAIPEGTGGKIQTFTYPGKIQDRKTHTTVFDGRAFYGQCLHRSDASVYVVFQREAVDKKGRKIQNSVFLAQAGEQFLEESLFERRLPRIQDTLKRVKGKTCFEIAGKSRQSLSRPLDVDLNKRSALEDDDDDDDATPQSKQN